jgi:hypothetical protein
MIQLSSSTTCRRKITIYNLIKDFTLLSMYSCSLPSTVPLISTGNNQGQTYDPWTTASAESIAISGDRSVTRGLASLPGASARGKNYRGESANVSRLLDSLLRGYDKRLRPNYGGKFARGAASDRVYGSRKIVLLQSTTCAT